MIGIGRDQLDMCARAVQHEFGREVSAAVGLPLWFEGI